MTVHVSVRANKLCFLITTLILQRPALPFSLDMASDVDMDLSDSDSSTSIDKLIQQSIDERR
jgi:hypothetical protein